jgi:hypothetical protein
LPKTEPVGLSQADKFKAAAVEAETDNSEEAFDALLKRVAGGKAGKKAAAPKDGRHDD